MSDWDRFNDQFREGEDERNERLATRRKKEAAAKAIVLREATRAPIPDAFFDGVEAPEDKDKGWR